MLLLTKIDHRKILVSLGAVKYFEAIPDTLIFFLNGESVIVRETLAEVQQAYIAYQQEIHMTPTISRPAQEFTAPALA